MKKIRVIVVDDSLLFRNYICDSINSQDNMEVIATAPNANDAMQKILRLNPDVVTLDIQMPGMSGLDLLKELLPKHQVPVILVSSLNMSVFEALSAGAVDFLGKPDFTIQSSKESFKANLISKVRIASIAKVRICSPKKSVADNSPSPLGILDSKKNNSLIPASVINSNIVAIGASTGGTEAIIQVIRDFPKDFPPVVITQHMAPGFTSIYAQRLNKICQMEVTEAKSGDAVKPGHIYLAPSGLHMKLIKIGSSININCFLKDRLHGVIPAVDYLFDSVAELYGSKAIGVILTGMGMDGATSLLNMKKNGAFTIGQNKETCVVYGMPMEAMKLGAVDIELPLDSIGNKIQQELKSRI